ERLGLLALGIVLLAQADQRAERLGIEAVGLGFRVDFLDVIGERLLFFLEPLDALDDRLQLVAGYALGLGHPTFLLALGPNGCAPCPAPRAASIARNHFPVHRKMMLDDVHFGIAIEFGDRRRETRGPLVDADIAADQI